MINFRVQRALSPPPPPPQDCSCGVLQGSVLGPLLFVVYISSSLKNVVNNYGVSHHQYADDTEVYVGVSKADKDNDSLKSSFRIVGNTLLVQPKLLCHQP